MKRNNEHGICCVFCTCVSCTVVSCVCVHRNYGINQITRHIKFISLSSNKGVIQGRMIICSVPAAPCLDARKHMLKPTDRTKYWAITMDKYTHNKWKKKKNARAVRVHWIIALPTNGGIFVLFSIFYFIYYFFCLYPANIRTTVKHNK